MNNLTTERGFKTQLRSSLSWIITFLLGSGIILSLINLKIIMIIGGLSVLAGILIGIIYSLIINGLTKIERLTIFMMSFFILIYFIFKIQHWKGIMITCLALIMPMGLFIFHAVKRDGRLKPEFSFMLILTILAFMSFFGLK
jgi:hypothetical protein